MFVLAAILGLTLAAGPAADIEDAGATAQSRVGSSVLAAFEATDLSGQRWTARQLRGRVILLDFWATWCAPCLAELPRLKVLRSRYARTDLEILGISLDATSRRSFVSWLNRNRIDWPQVLERGGYDGAIPRLFNVDYLPRTVVIGRDGRVAAVDLRGERLANAIDKLIAQPPEAVEARK
jgi:thiol-disulfide isomerase/thioredoxin